MAGLLSCETLAALDPDVRNLEAEGAGSFCQILGFCERAVCLVSWFLWLVAFAVVKG